MQEYIEYYSAGWLSSFHYNTIKLFKQWIFCIQWLRETYFVTTNTKFVYERFNISKEQSEPKINQMITISAVFQYSCQENIHTD